MGKLSWNERLNTGINLGVVIFAIVLLARPGGLIGEKLQQREAERSLREAVSREWSALTTGPRIDSQDVGVALLVEFSDYQCPYCRDAHPRIEELTSSLQIGVVYKHLPLTAIHPHAEGAARAAVCAEQQGRFREIHGRLFADRSWEQTQAWATIAHAAGLPDTTRFNECLSSESTSQRLADDVALARRLGIQATPTFVGPAGTFVGVPTAELVAKALAR